MFTDNYTETQSFTLPTTAESTATTTVITTHSSTKSTRNMPTTVQSTTGTPTTTHRKPSTTTCGNSSPDVTMNSMPEAHIRRGHISSTHSLHKFCLTTDTGIYQEGAGTNIPRSGDGHNTFPVRTYSTSKMSSVPSTLSTTTEQ